MTPGIKISYLFIASALLAIIFPLFNLYYIVPTATDVLVRYAEKDAIQMARHLKSLATDSHGKFRSNQEINKVVSSAWRYLNIENIKIIAHDGKVIYSPERELIGTLIDKQYFTDIIAKGQIYSKISSRNAMSLDGHPLKADVVEVYVPVMSNDVFIGAFELYYDITDLNQELNAATLRSSLLSLLLMVCFFAIIILIILRKSSKRFEKEISDSTLKARSPYYYLLVIAGTLFITETIVMLIIQKFPPMQTYTEALMDSALLLMLASPMLYLFLYYPLSNSIKEQRKLLGEKELLMKEAYHRVKNNLNTVSNLLMLQSETTQNLEAKDMFDVGMDRLNAMALIHERLYKSRNLNDIDCAEYIETLVNKLFENYQLDSDKVKLVKDINELHIDIDTLIPLGLIINEVVTNALKYAFPGDRSGTIFVSVSSIKHGSCTITVKDDGIGFAYDDSKDEVKTLGLQLIEGLTLQLNGQLNINTQNGTEISITINCDRQRVVLK